MAIDYFARKNELAERAFRWQSLMNKCMSEKIKESIDGTIHYKKDFRLNEIVPRYSSMNITCINAYSQDVAYTAGSKFEGKSAVLNFASYTHPGGKFIEGSSAQEESLCHRSTLYNVLINFLSEFYSENKKNITNYLYNDNLLYSPNIYFNKDDYDTDYDQFVPCDVITCAAPNKSSATRYKRVDDYILWCVLMNRIDQVLRVAYDQKVDNLILGAFGCGVFGNDPYDVALIFTAFLESKYFGCFKNAIYAVPKMNDLDGTMFYFKQCVFRHPLSQNITHREFGDILHLTEPVKEIKLLKGEKYTITDLTIERIKKEIKEKGEF